jgi:hypothetical protein
MTGSVTQSPAAYLSPWPIDENNQSIFIKNTIYFLRTFSFVVLFAEL